MYIYIYTYKIIYTYIIYIFMNDVHPINCLAKNLAKKHPLRDIFAGLGRPGVLQALLKKVEVVRVLQSMMKWMIFG